jgi:hypothetical protein
MLGLEVDLESRTLTVDPSLPPWLSTVTISDLPVLGVRGSLQITKSDDGYAIYGEGLPLAE